MKDNKFVPVAPKTYEVRYVENKEPGKLFKLASYLGVKTVYNCNEKDCKCVVKTAEDAAKVAAAVAAAMAEVAAKNKGDKVESNTTPDGTTTTTYHSKSK